MNPQFNETEAMDRTGSVSDPNAPRWGHLQVLAKVGSGSFGTVYRTWDTVLHRQVALKLLPKGSGDDLLAEARTLAGIDDPHVIRVLGADVNDGTPGLWMDFVEGVNLATRVNESGRLDLAETVACGVQLARGLSAVHDAGLLHRDIKPANVMQRPDGGVVLMDLGTGRPRAVADERYAGTPHFMAPEVLSDGVESPRSDIYSLGAVLYNLISGELPVTGSNLDELRWIHSSGSATELEKRRPDLPRDFLDLVARATASDPAHRFDSAEALASALAEVGKKVSLPGRRNRRTGLLAAIVAVVFAAIIGWQTLWSGPGDGLPLDGTITYVGYHEGIAMTLVGDDTIAPGDRLGINLELSSPAFVYILNRDESGAVTVMYPLAGNSDSGRLDAHKRHYLPGLRGEQRLGWTFNTIAGKESFVVVASQERLDEFEQQLATLPVVDIGGGLTVRPAGAPTIASLLRGISGLAGVSLPTTPSNGADLADLVNFTAAPGGTDSKSRIWVHEMKLRNAGL